MKRLFFILIVFMAVTIPGKAWAADPVPLNPQPKTFPCTQDLFNTGFCDQAPVTNPIIPCTDTTFAAGQCVIDGLSRTIPSVNPGVTAGLSEIGKALITAIINPKCDQAPTPSTPGTGTDPNPSGGNSTLYDQTGYGPQWSTFNTGCVPNAAASLDTGAGNFFYGLSIDVASFSNGLHKWVSPPTFLGVFDKLETTVTQSFFNGLYKIFIPISVAVLGVIIVAKSKNQNIPEVARLAGWAIAVMALVALVATSPLRLGQVADRSETQAISAVNSAVGGSASTNSSSVANLEVGSVLYPMWLQGELGSSTSAVAVKYGPDLWRSQTLTWAEAASPDRAKIVTQKQKDFANIAAAIGDQDPIALSHLEGKATGRWAVGLESLFGVLCTVAFRIVADMMVIISLALIRLVVLFIPILAVIGLHERMRHLIKIPLEISIAAVINTVMFAAAAAAIVLLVGLTLSNASGLPTWLALVTSLVASVFLWYLTKPMRKLTVLAKSLSFHDAIGHTAWHGRRGAELLKGVVVGGAAEKIYEHRKRKAMQEQADQQTQERPETRPMVESPRYWREEEPAPEIRPESESTIEEPSENFLDDFEVHRLESDGEQLQFDFDEEKVS